MPFPRFFTCCHRKVSPADVIRYCAFPGKSRHPNTIPTIEDIINLLTKTLDGTTIDNTKIAGIAENGIEKKHLFSPEDAVPDHIELFHPKYAYLKVKIPLACANDEKIRIDINNIVSILDNHFKTSLSHEDLLRAYFDINSPPESLTP